MTPRQIELRIKRIKRELMKLGPMRPGALSMQYAACKKPGCACVDPVKPKKHGPFYQLSYSQLGKSTTRFVRPNYAGQIKKELAGLHALPRTDPGMGHTRTGSLPATPGSGSPERR